MTGDQFRSTLNARPFVPFTLRTADGETCYIANSATAWAPPTGRLAFVANANGSAKLIDIRFITTIEFDAKDAADQILE
jgi:hypothetical protein